MGGAQRPEVCIHLSLSVRNVFRHGEKESGQAQVDSQSESFI